jgi:hypothetical protein
MSSEMIRNDEELLEITKNDEKLREILKVIKKQEIE